MSALLASAGGGLIKVALEPILTGAAQWRREMLRGTYLSMHDGKTLTYEAGLPNLSDGL